MDRLQLTPEEDRRKFIRMESDARNFLRRLELQNYQDSLPPPQNAVSRGFVENLREALESKPGAGGCAINGENLSLLREHARFMDMAFRRLIGDADIIDGRTGASQCVPPLYLAAFRAQEQFRKTVSTISDLEEKAARAARRKAGKNRHKNNGMRPVLRKKPNPRIKRTDKSPAFCLPRDVSAVALAKAESGDLSEHSKTLAFAGEAGRGVDPILPDMRNIPS